MNNEKYFGILRERRIAVQQAHPEGCCLVVSVENLERNSTAGHICEVPNEQAAQLLTEGTHRLAAKEETAQFRKEHETARLRSTRPAHAMDSVRAQFEALVGKKKDGAK